MFISSYLQLKINENQVHFLPRPMPTICGLSVNCPGQLREWQKIRNCYKKPRERKEHLLEDDRGLGAQGQEG